MCSREVAGDCAAPRSVKITWSSGDCGETRAEATCDPCISEVDLDRGDGESDCSTNGLYPTCWTANTKHARRLDPLDHLYGLPKD